MAIRKTCKIPLLVFLPAILICSPAVAVRPLGLHAYRVAAAARAAANQSSVAVIGAGPAGTAAALQILNTDETAQVTLYDKEGRACTQGKCRQQLFLLAGGHQKFLEALGLWKKENGKSESSEMEMHKEDKKLVDRLVMKGPYGDYIPCQSLEELLLENSKAKDFKSQGRLILKTLDGTEIKDGELSSKFVAKYDLVVIAAGAGSGLTIPFNDQSKTLVPQPWPERCPEEKQTHVAGVIRIPLEELRDADVDGMSDVNTVLDSLAPYVRSVRGGDGIFVFPHFPKEVNRSKSGSMDSSYNVRFAAVVPDEDKGDLQEFFEFHVKQKLIGRFEKRKRDFINEINNRVKKNTDADQIVFQDTDTAKILKELAKPKILDRFIEILKDDSYRLSDIFGVDVKENNANSLRTFEFQRKLIASNLNATDLVLDKQALSSGSELVSPSGLRGKSKAPRGVGKVVVVPIGDAVGNGHWLAGKGVYTAIVKHNPILHRFIKSWKNAKKAGAAKDQHTIDAVNWYVRATRAVTQNTWLLQHFEGMAKPSELEVPHEKLLHLEEVAEPKAKGKLQKPKAKGEATRTKANRKQEVKQGEPQNAHARPIGPMAKGDRMNRIPWR